MQDQWSSRLFRRARENGQMTILVCGDVGNRNLYCEIIAGHLTGNEMNRRASGG